MIHGPLFHGLYYVWNSTCLTRTWISQIPDSLLSSLCLSSFGCQNYYTIHNTISYVFPSSFVVLRLVWMDPLQPCSLLKSLSVQTHLELPTSESVHLCNSLHFHKVSDLLPHSYWVNPWCSQITLSCIPYRALPRLLGPLPPYFCLSLVYDESKVQFLLPSTPSQNSFSNRISLNTLTF